jgi:proline dehydrogenase
VDLDVAGSIPVTRPIFSRKSISDEGADPVLNMLRAILATQDEHGRTLDQVITRLSALERDFAGMKMDFAGTHARLDNISRRLDRVERRLDLVDERTP